MFFLFFPEICISFTSFIVQTTSIYLAWIQQPLQLACFLLCNNSENSSASA